MDDLVAIGTTLGVGVAIGLVLAALLASWRHGLVASVVASVAAAVAVGLLLEGWIGLPGALLGPVLGAGSASIVARGALRRGATPGGTAVLLGVAGLVLGALALVPVVGYLLAVLVPGVAVRRARREPERFAGLRTLAR